MRFFETTDYDGFAFIDGNRPIVDGNVKRFVQIIKDGELHDEIQVNPTKVKGKWVIVDGQHRFLAHQILGLPVPVIVKRKNVPLKGIVQINTIRKDWTVLDRVKSFAKLGDKNYQRLLELWGELNAIQPIPINRVAKLCQGSLATSRKKGQSANINEGSWVFVKSEDEVRKVFQECLVFTKDHPDAMSETFIHCIQTLMENQPGFDIKRLQTAAKKNPHMFIRAARKQDMLRMLEELYNFKRMKVNRLYFDMNNL
jgi:hypothetical protein